MYQGGDSDQDERDDGEEEAEEARESFTLAQKILGDDMTTADTLDAEELEAVASNPVLKQAYNSRWYRYDNNETYFILVNMSSDPIKPG